MELRDFIEMGAHKAGSVAALARLLDLTREATTQAKSHKRKLPTDAVMKLADYIGVELRVITAANELVTEKDEAKRNFYRPFVEHARAASIAVSLLIVGNFVTPTPVEAAPILKVESERLCIMLNRMNRLFKQHKLNRGAKLLFKTFATMFGIWPLEHQAI